MVLYNVTVKIDPSVHDEWLQWMQRVHIPDVMRTNLFIDNRICRVLGQNEEDGITYAIQYFCKSMEDYEMYQLKFAPTLQQEHAGRYPNKFVAFRTLMEIL